MTEKNIGALILLGIVAVAAIILSASLLLNPVIKEKIVEVQAPEKAMPLFIFDSWGENLNNSQESIFEGWIYNYGLVEAKNVTIRCYVTRNGAEVYSSFYNSPNVGSESYTYLSITKKYISSIEDLGMCEVSSCDNCINLNSRMPKQ